MKVSLVDGEICWTCSDCSGDEPSSPRQPWPGILEVSPDKSMQLARCNRYGELVDEMFDWATVRDEDLFATEEDAMHKYRDLCKKYADELVSRAFHFYAKSQIQFELHFKVPVDLMILTGPGKSSDFYGAKKIVVTQNTRTV